MGMIFNSGHTGEIVGKLNTHYNLANFQDAGLYDPPILQDANKSLYEKSVALRIDLQDRSLNWKTYLDEFELYLSSTDTIPLGKQVTSLILGFLKDPKCTSIQFFTHEAAIPSVSSVPPAPLGPGSEPYFAAINVQTMTYDSAGWRHHSGSRRAKGSRKRAAPPGVRTPGARRKPSEE